MEDWLTYRLSDLLLFSPRTYYRLFELYNRGLWAAHAAALVAGVGIVVMLWRDVMRGPSAIVLLSICWLWIAWAFHLERYATINWIAPYFAAAFALQATLMLLYAVRQDVVQSRRRQAAPVVPRSRLCSSRCSFSRSSAR